MRSALALFLGLATLLCGAAPKRKPPDVEVLEVKCQRNEGRVTVDGTVRNSGRKAIANLNLLFDFLTTDDQVVTTRRHGYKDEVLEPGQELGFQLYFADPVRAVTFSMRAESKDGRELRLGNAGPFPIE